MHSQVLNAPKNMRKEVNPIHERTVRSMSNIVQAPGPSSGHRPLRCAGALRPSSRRWVLRPSSAGDDHEQGANGLMRGRGMAGRGTAHLFCIISTLVTLY